MNPQGFYGEIAKAKQQTHLLPQPDISEESDLYSNSQNKLYEYDDSLCETEDSEEYDENQGESTTASIPSASKSKKICYILSDLLKTIIAQYLKHNKAFILKVLYIWLCDFCYFSNKTAFKKGSSGLAKERK